MKSIILKMMAGIAIACSCQAQTDCSISAMNQELEKRYEKDQEIRKEFMPLLAAYQKDGSGKMKLVMKALKMEQIDKKNQEVLSKYLVECGWPDELSEKSHKAIFYILQHASDSLMSAYFPMVAKRVADGYLLPDDWATMFDRLRMNAGEPQRFGTQTFAGDDNINWIWPIESADKLQQRRDSVGLPDMETYFQLALDSMGVTMKWDKDLTVEEAESRRSSESF